MTADLGTYTDAAAADQVVLPSGLALGERMTAALRAYLDRQGLGHWTVFCPAGNDLDDLDPICPALGVARPVWDPLPGLTAGGEQPAFAVRRPPDPAAVEPADPEPGTVRPWRADDRGLEARAAGALWLRDHDVVVARWFAYDDGQHFWVPVCLVAARSADHYHRLRRRVAEATRRPARPVWHVVDGTPWPDPPIPRDTTLSLDGLVLADDVKRRLGHEVGGFFAPAMAGLHARLRIPYRRGVLLYGPPGNGKTSLIRAVAGMNPHVPALLLRPADDFTDKGLRHVLAEWQDRAPALLVIEDLDWLFHQKSVGVAAFLNMLDGVDRRDGGLLLLATTNHPEDLDPAINNRPGRFDVCLEIRNPGPDLRARYFATADLAADLDPAAIVDRTDGLSFAHLREVESLSGMLALQAGREARTAADVLAAADLVARSAAEARDGFPPPGKPFGLHRRRGR